jgi:tetratricopeptide (TPR) repeat protein
VQSCPYGSPDNLTAVLEIIGELARKSEGRSYIYRGEHGDYPKVSSSLYRRYESIDEAGDGILSIQEAILEHAKAHDLERNDRATDEDILAELRHNGGETNLIDFTSDYLIALFFACDGAHGESGRVHLLPVIGDGYRTFEPRQPVHRVVAQKSVFVRADKGFVQPEETVTIDANHKAALLEFLRVCHGISSVTIYNDLYGIIQHQAVHRDAYDALYEGVALAEKGSHQQAIQRYTACIGLNPQMASAYSNRADAYHELGEYESAIADYRKALKFDARNDSAYHNLGVAHAAQGDYHQAIHYYDQALQLNDDEYTRYYRFEAWLLLEEWEKAREVALSAEVSWDDISSLLREHYENVPDFEQKNDVRLPDDLAELLGGREN